MEGSSYEGALGAPLNLLLSSKKKFEDLNDKKVEKLHKVSTFTFTTHTLTSNTASRKCQRLASLEERGSSGHHCHLRQNLILLGGSKAGILEFRVV